MKTKISLFLIIIILFSFIFATNVNATSIEDEDPYGYYSIPISIVVSSKFSSWEISQLQEAINEWNSVGLGTLFVYKGTVYDAEFKPVGVVSVSKSSIDTVGKTIRVANVDEEGNKVAIDAKVYINSNYTYNNGSTTSGTYYLKSVLMHELGHVLGLRDSAYRTSVMFRYYTGATAIHYTDLNTLQELY
ncbi:MAG: matrixin family metalloprotease [Clostridia bacterium]|nr:matrixin family metalloprotease [Clostridia bacterium]